MRTLLPTRTKAGLVALFLLLSLVVWSLTGAALSAGEVAGNEDRRAPAPPSMPAADVVASQASAPSITCPAGGVLYVKADAAAGGDGTSWATAFNNLQSALAVTNACQIWLAKGRYRPTSNPTDRAASFQLASGVKLYGGFAGTELDISQRDLIFNLTILSGDIDNNDPVTFSASTANIVGGNSYHVVRLDGSAAAILSSTVIDGVIITGGLANGSEYPHDLGAGLFCYGQASRTCSPTLRNVRFYGNKAAFGGGLYNEGFDGTSSPTLTNVSFWGNQATGSGGAIYNRGSGGVSSPFLTNVLFVQNSAAYAGAVYNDGYQGNSSPNFTNVTLSGNTSTNEGGALLNDGFGGQSTPHLINTILWGNTGSSGSQIYNDDATLSLRHSIVQQKDGPGIVNNGSSSVTDGGGNLAADPLFVDAPNGDLRLRSGSPARDSGDNWAVYDLTLTDLYGGPRIFNGTVDMGAHEASMRTCPAGGRIYVNGSQPPGGDGSSWGRAFTFLEDALAVSVPCQIWVAKGVYRPSPSQNRWATFSVPWVVALYGGFNGTETALDQRNWTANPTILSGDLDGNDDFNQNGVVDVGEEPTGINSYNVLTLDGTIEPITPNVVIDGFTIQGGLGDDYLKDIGAGLYCNAQFDGTCRPTLHNLIFVGNKAAKGGALFNHAQGNGTASPRMRNVAFRHNVATDSGGAIYNLADGPGSQAAPYIMRAAFTDNRSLGTSVYSGGGAIYNHFDLKSNSSDALYLVNGLFLRNSAASDGGAIYNRLFEGYVSPYLAFVTMADNSADKGGGIFSQVIGSTNSFNQNIGSSILWNNTASEGGPQIYIEGADNSVDISFSLVGGGDAGIVGSTAFSDGTGNIDADPRFRDGDKRLGTGSPAIDAAQVSNLPEDMADWPDMDGNRRIVDVGSVPDTGAYFSNIYHNAAADMGAYEYSSSPCPTGSRLYVDQDAGGGGLTGDSWTDAYLSVSNALEAAQLCDGISEVWVAEGVHTPPSVRASFVLPAGVAVYGGFNGSETAVSGRNLTAHPTILSGDVEGDDLNSDGNQIAESTDQIRGVNSQKVVRVGKTDTMTESFRLDGFTITAGNGASGGAGLDCFVYYAGCNLALANLTFAGNYAVRVGGALYVDSWYVPSNVTLTDVTFSGNRAGGQGGGLYWYSHSTGTGAGEENHLVVRNGRFENNQAESGGAIFMRRYYGMVSATLTNMTFRGNSAGGTGGAIHIGDDGDFDGAVNLTLTNGLFWRNTAQAKGGAIFGNGTSASANLALTNVTLHNNTAGTTGGAIAGAGGADASFTADLDNVILWGNQDGTGQNEMNLIGGSSATIDTSIVHGGNGGVVTDGSATPFGSGTGNLNADPLFVDASTGNLHLQPTSPAIDAGNNTAISGTSLDLDGNTRIANGTVDMGAYEIQPTAYFVWLPGVIR